VSLVTLLIVLAIGFFVVMQVLGAMRRSGKPVAPKVMTPEEAALQKLFEKPIESEAQLRELMRAAEASRKQRPPKAVTQAEPAGELSDGLRAAMGIASVVAAERIVTTATKKKKKDKKAQTPRVEPTHSIHQGARSALQALAVIDPYAPLSPIHSLRPIAPLSPLAPHSVRSARS
jgi:hypothetical protein